MNLRKYIQSEAFTRRMDQSRRHCKEEMETKARTVIMEALIADKVEIPSREEIDVMVAASVTRAAIAIQTQYAIAAANGPFGLAVAEACFQVVPIMAKHQAEFYDAEEPHIPKHNDGGPK